MLTETTNNQMTFTAEEIYRRFGCGGYTRVVTQNGRGRLSHREIAEQVFQCGCGLWVNNIFEEHERVEYWDGSENIICGFCSYQREQSQVLMKMETARLIHMETGEWPEWAFDETGGLPKGRSR